MTVGRILARGRRAHLALMRDTIVITRPAQQVTDPTTGQVTSTSLTVYSGPADVKPDFRPTPVETQQRVEVKRFDVGLPFGTTAEIHLGDVLMVVTADDPQFAGRTLAVLDAEHGSRRTARHVICEEQEAG